MLILEPGFPRPFAVVRHTRHRPGSASAPALPRHSFSLGRALPCSESPPGNSGCSVPQRGVCGAGTGRCFRLLTSLSSTPLSREQCCPSCIIWKWFTGITKPIFFFFFFFFPPNNYYSFWLFALAALGNLCRRDGTRGLKTEWGVRDLIFKQLEWFLSFFKRCTCLWYCLSSEMITAPLLYWYNIVHASVVFLYSSLKFINLYCRCYVFLWQNSLQNFFKVF